MGTLSLKLGVSVRAASSQDQGTRASDLSRPRDQEMEKWEGLWQAGRAGRFTLTAHQLCARLGQTCSELGLARQLGQGAGT